MLVWSAIFGLAALSGALGLPTPLQEKSHDPLTEPGLNTTTKTTDVKGITARIRQALEQTSVKMGDEKAVNGSTTPNPQVDKRDAKCDNCPGGKCKCTGNQCICSAGCQNHEPADDAFIPAVTRIERDVSLKVAEDTDDDDEEEEDDPKKKNMNPTGGYEAVLKRERQLYVRSIDETPEEKKDLKNDKLEASQPGALTQVINDLNQVRLRRELAKTVQVASSEIKSEVDASSIEPTKITKQAAKGSLEEMTGKSTDVNQVGNHTEESLSSPKQPATTALDEKAAATVKNGSATPKASPGETNDVVQKKVIREIDNKTADVPLKVRVAASEQSTQLIEAALGESNSKGNNNSDTMDKKTEPDQHARTVQSKVGPFHSGTDQIETKMKLKSDDPSTKAKSVRELPSGKQSTDTKKIEETVLPTQDNQKNAKSKASPNDREFPWGSNTQDSDSWQNERRLGGNRGSNNVKIPNFHNLDIRYLGGNDLPIPPVDDNSEARNIEKSDQTSANMPLHADLPRMSASNQMASALYLTSMAALTALQLGVK